MGMKMEAKRSSETLVHTRCTRRHIPEDGILHSHRRENLKSYTTPIKVYIHIWAPLYICFISVGFAIVIIQYQVAIATNSLALTCFMNVSYVVGHERASSLYFQYIVSLL
jgi:hypothetical protein